MVLSVGREARSSEELIIKATPLNTDRSGPLAIQVSHLDKSERVTSRNYIISGVR